MSSLTPRQNATRSTKPPKWLWTKTGLILTLLRYMETSVAWISFICSVLSVLMEIGTGSIRVESVVVSAPRAVTLVLTSADSPAMVVAGRSLPGCSPKLSRYLRRRRMPAPRCPCRVRGWSFRRWRWRWSFEGDCVGIFVDAGEFLAGDAKVG